MLFRSAGDKLTAVDGEKCTDLTVLSSTLREGGTDPLRLTLKRGDGEVSVLMDRPARRERRGATTQPSPDGAATEPQPMRGTPGPRTQPARPESRPAEPVRSDR